MSLTFLCFSRLIDKIYLCRGKIAAVYIKIFSTLQTPLGTPIPNND